MSHQIRNQTVSTRDSPGFVFLILSVPFYLNDFAFILLSGSDGVYVADYVTRALVLIGCFMWPVARAFALEKQAPVWRVELAVLCVLLLPVMSRTAYHALEAWGHNLACAGRGADRKYQLVIPRWHLALKNIWPFHGAAYQLRE